MEYEETIKLTFYLLRSAHISYSARKNTFGVRYDMTIPFICLTTAQHIFRSARDSISISLITWHCIAKMTALCNQSAACKWNVSANGIWTLNPYIEIFDWFPFVTHFRFSSQLGMASSSIHAGNGASVDASVDVWAFITMGDVLEMWFFHNPHQWE